MEDNWLEGRHVTNLLFDSWQEDEWCLVVSYLPMENINNAELLILNSIWGVEVLPQLWNAFMYCNGVLHGGFQRKLCRIIVSICIAVYVILLIYQLQLWRFSFSRLNVLTAGAPVAFLLALQPTLPRLSVHFIVCQFDNESIFVWLLLSTVHSTTPQRLPSSLLHSCTLHRISFALPLSISSPNVVSILLMPLGFLTSKPFSYKFPPSTSEIYRL